MEAKRRQNYDMIPLADLAKPYKNSTTYVAIAARILHSGVFVRGSQVRSFEHKFAAYCKRRYCIGAGSGTDALSIALRSIAIGPGDEVIIPAFTFVSTAFAVIAAGAKPVLVDVDPRTLLLDPEKLQHAITPHTKAILPVHLYGVPAPMGAIGKIAKTHHLAVIEDAAQAHGSLYRNKRAGSLGTIGCFSFYPSKNLGAAGDAGAIVTNNAAIARNARRYANLGEQRKYRHVVVGINSRLDAIQAAILQNKLLQLDRANQKRRSHAQLYATLLAHLPVSLPHIPSDITPNYHLFVIRTDTRHALRTYLSTRGIETGIHYPIPLHMQPALRQLGYKRGDFPISERAAKEVLSLPMYPELTPQDIRYICTSISSFFAKRQIP